MNYDISKSKRNEDQIIYRNYVFSKHITRNNHQVWRCRFLGCRSTGYTHIDYLTADSFFILDIDHNHPPEESLIARRELLNHMKNIMKNMSLTPYIVVDTIMRGAGVEQIRILGDYEAVYRTLRRFKAIILNPQPHNAFGLNETLTITHIDTPFFR